MVFNILWKQRLETSGLDPKLTKCKFAALLLSYITFFLIKKFNKIFKRIIFNLFYYYVGWF